MRRMIVIAFFQQLAILSSAFMCMDFNFCLFYIERGILICWRITLRGREIYLLREHPSENHAVLKYRSTSTLSDFAQILCKVT